MYTIIVSKNKDFPLWLLLEIEKKGWSQSELARRAGLSRTAINDIINRKTSPGPDFCRSIAKALGYPQEYVFRLAGLITDPYPPSTDPETHMLAQLLTQLSPEDREELLALVRLKLARRQTSSTSTTQQSRPKPALER